MSVKLIPTNLTCEGKRIWLQDGESVLAHIEYRVGEVGDRPLLVSDRKLPPREPVELKE